jgi:arginine-tRNA-protein transferase
VRILVSEFTPNRSQKRAVNQHQNLKATILTVEFHEEHYALYADYQRSRHADTFNTETSEANEVEQYQNFLCQTNVESVMVEFRDNDVLKMVSVIDIVHDGISAVYTFYDASDANNNGDSSGKRPSYGTYNVMWQAEWAKSLNLPYLYLGYWIKDSQKMAYKKNYRPLEKLINGDWVKGE